VPRCRGHLPSLHPCIAHNTCDGAHNSRLISSWSCPGTTCTHFHFPTRLCTLGASWCILLLLVTCKHKCSSRSVTTILLTDRRCAGIISLTIPSRNPSANQVDERGLNRGRKNTLSAFSLRVLTTRRRSSGESPQHALALATSEITK
jgi:hypothetical protein